MVNLLVWLNYYDISYPKVYPAPLGEIPHPPLSSGSDHNKSHIGPSWGTSWILSNFLISSRVSVDGDNPPCNQKKLFSTTADNGK